jgi:hypothetical protein
MNMAKFTSEDLILFMGITNDLFPNIQQELQEVEQRLKTIN